MRILITGGAGFIGSAMCRYFIYHTSNEVLNFDVLTYAGNLSSVKSIADNPRYRFIHADIRDSNAVRKALESFRPHAILHMAAESHVDRSIDAPADFIQTNINGTFTLLQESLRYWRTSSEELFLFVYVSTDEVYGALGDTGTFTEESPMRPNSPYSASKVAGECLARAWHKTYGLPVIIANSSNTYGPFQYVEKLIPLTITNALQGKPIPIYGTGKNVRDWMYVDDHARALVGLIENGVVGEKYNIAGGCELTNIDLVHRICTLLDELKPRENRKSYADLILFVTDRLGHDWRYALACEKIRRDLGWTPQVSLAEGLRKTVKWYLTKDLS